MGNGKGLYGGGNDRSNRVRWKGGDNRTRKMARGSLRTLAKEGGTNMDIQIELRKLIYQHNIHERGLEQKIAAACGCHRHTIGKLMRSQMKNPSLEVLGNVCRWLVEKGVPGDSLPGALFAFRPMEVWKAIGGSNRVAIYLGMYVRKNMRTPAVPANKVLSRDDAQVAARITTLLNLNGRMGNRFPVVTTQYVPFQYNPRSPDFSGEKFKEDKQRAVNLFRRMKENRMRENAILLGSQRVNYLVETLVADLFGCKPFEPIRKHTKVPFYLCYREFDLPVPSCFGGREPPPGFKGRAKCGTYYLDEHDQWQVLEWVQDKQDAGIVIVIREAGSVQMAAFGCSGRATSALGISLIDHPERFWPHEQEGIKVAGKDEEKSAEEGDKSRKKKKTGPSLAFAQHNGREIMVLVCSVTFCGENREPEVPEEWGSERDIVEVKGLSPKVLKRYLG